MKAIPTTAIAIWGASLSTFVLLRDLWRSRARALVAVGYTAVTSDRLPGRPPFVVAATISNRGRESIFLEAAVLQVESGTTMHSSQFVNSLPLPIELRPGQSYKAHFEADTIHAICNPPRSRYFRIAFFDQLNRTYWSGFLAPANAVRGTDSNWELSLGDAPPHGAVGDLFRRMWLTTPARKVRGRFRSIT